MISCLGAQDHAGLRPLWASSPCIPCPHKTEEPERGVCAPHRVPQAGARAQPPPRRGESDASRCLGTVVLGRRPLGRGQTGVQVHARGCHRPRQDERRSGCNPRRGMPPSAASLRPCKELGKFFKALRRAGAPSGPTISCLEQAIWALEAEAVVSARRNINEFYTFLINFTLGL